MSRLQLIENQLKSINGAVFQELCDSYLVIKNENYSTVSRVGSQVGKQKTRKGTPDTYFLLPNGNFLFCEITTDISTKRKLFNDIQACFDYKKSKIPIKRVEEIIICINWNLDQNEVLELTDFAQKFKRNIVLSFITLQELAIDLQFNYRNLTHQYLGLPLDTGQIVSIESFIKEYDRGTKGIATPLNNSFLHREDELVELKKKIDENDFVILSGAPGVGKTKLAIETINNYLENHLSFQAYCVSYKSHPLLDDLYQYFNSEKDYILFVDDANRIDAFNQITGFFKSNRIGKLKVLITVRDYAFNDIQSKCLGFNTKNIGLEKLGDEQIKDIIQLQPFEILNYDFQKEIIRIADGNPRLAIMASLLAKETQDIRSLNDVSSLFEKYFSTFVFDDGEFEKKINLKSLGLISFFYTIPYKDRQVTESILQNFDITYGEFIDAIEVLERLELIQIQFEYVKIGEQNLATYFFYKVFIQDNLLSFQTLLDSYYKSNSSRFRHSIIPANNTFGHERVMEKLKLSLKTYWHQINDNIESFQFLDNFWLYLQEQTLEFILIYISQLSNSPSNNEEENVYFHRNFDTKDQVIELLGHFFLFRSEKLKTALEVAFEYIRVSPNKLPSLLNKINDVLTFDKEDESTSFYRQRILFEVLIKNFKSGEEQHVNLFYTLSSTFLRHEFNQHRGGRKGVVYFYRYLIPNNHIIQGIRGDVWTLLYEHFENYPALSFGFLKSSAHVYPSINKNIMEFDIPFILKIIGKHLETDNFEHCKYVNDQIWWFERHNFYLSRFEIIRNEFTNPTYKTFLILDVNWHKNKDVVECDTPSKYLEFKRKKIRTAFILKSEKSIQEFYTTFKLLWEATSDKWYYSDYLDIIVDANLTANFEMGIQLMREIFTDNNSMNYKPNLAFANHLSNKKHAEIIWQQINEIEFNLKNICKLSFHENLSNKLVTAAYVNSLIQTVKEINISMTFHFDGLEKYKSKNPKLFQTILKIIYNKNEKEKLRIQIWFDTFIKYFNEFEHTLILLKKSYIQQYIIQHSFSDCEDEAFIKMLEKNKKFLLEFLVEISKDNEFQFSNDNHERPYVWDIDGIEHIMISIFNLLIHEKNLYTIPESYINVFFQNLNDEQKVKADAFLKNYVTENCFDFKKMNLVINIIHISRKEIYEEILLLYISSNQDKDSFMKLTWTLDEGGYSGNINFGDLKAAQWRNILSIVNKSSLGYKLLPIKAYLTNVIESCLQSADDERKRKFISLPF